MSTGVSASKSKQTSSTTDKSIATGSLIGSSVGGEGSDLSSYAGAAYRMDNAGSVNISAPAEMWDLLGFAGQSVSTVANNALVTSANTMENALSLKAATEGVVTDQTRKLFIYGAIAIVGLIVLYFVFKKK